MGRRRTKAQQFDRIVHTGTGEMGTIMDEFYPKNLTPRFAVMRDDGPKETVVWSESESEWHEASAGRHCHRCGDDTHTVVECPYGDCGAHLTTAGRDALVALGLDPRRIPGASDGEDAYDGVRLWRDARGESMYQPMRRRVCTQGDVVVDGHEMSGGACVHCGHKDKPAGRRRKATTR